MRGANRRRPASPVESGTTIDRLSQSGRAVSRPRGFVWSPFAVHHGVEATLRKAKLDRGTRHPARTIGLGRALRAPDPPLEPQDAPFHPGRAQRYLPDRPAKDPRWHRDELRLRA